MLYLATFNLLEAYFLVGKCSGCIINNFNLYSLSSSQASLKEQYHKIFSPFFSSLQTQKLWLLSLLFSWWRSVWWGPSPGSWSLTGRATFIPSTGELSAKPSLKLNQTKHEGLKKGSTFFSTQHLNSQRTPRYYRISQWPQGHWNKCRIWAL